jgi:hypothetical protein
MTIRIKSTSNCPTGEYPAIFCNSEVVKYPKGKRQILSFLIMNEDNTKPRSNNMGDNYYAVAVCNPSKGSNPKSKVHKILKAMLTEDEYDPLHSELALPSMDEYLPSKGLPNRIIKVRVKKVGDDKQASLVSHIKRPRDNEWECVEGEFEGTYNMPTDPFELYKKLRPKISKKFLDSTDDYIKSFTSKSQPYYDENGKFIIKPDYEKMHGEQSAISKMHKKLLNFLETQDLKVLFPELSNK